MVSYPKSTGQQFLLHPISLKEVARTSYKDQAHFTQTAYGSLMEAACQFEVAKDLGFIDVLQLDDILNRIAPLADKLSALRKSQLNRLVNKLSTINSKQ